MSDQATKPEPKATKCSRREEALYQHSADHALKLCVPIRLTVTLSPHSFKNNHTACTSTPPPAPPSPRRAPNPTYSTCTPQTDHCPPSVLAHLPALIEHAGGGSAMQSTTRGWAEWDATAPQHLQARAHPSPHMLSEVEHSRTVVCKATETSMREG